MRFKINLSLSNPNLKTLPLNYQYELSAYIYRTIANGDANYAEWLHQNGFKMEEKQFRLFTFSNFIIPQKTIDKENARLIIKGNNASFLISFLPERSTEEFVKGVFANQIFSIGDKLSKAEFTINNIELLPSPNNVSEFIGETLSPICITLRNDFNRIDYLIPSHAQAGELIKNNLLNKYVAFHDKEYSGDLYFEWETLSEPRSKLITIKSGTPQQTKIKGYNCQFRIKAAPELLKIAFEAGIGEKNSMGFGMFEVIGGKD